MFTDSDCTGSPDCSWWSGDEVNCGLTGCTWQDSCEGTLMTDCGGDVPCDCSIGRTYLNESRTLDGSDDLTGCADGLVINAADITLDCDFYSLVGTGANTGVTVNYDGASIKNCNISGYDYGMRLENVGGATITNNNITGITTTGILLSNSGNNVISGKEISGCGDVGIKLTDGSTGNTITGVYMHDDTNGAVRITDSDSNTLDANNLDHNCGVVNQIYMDSSASVTIKNNNITDGTGAGIIADSCDSLTLSNNNVSYNNNAGVDLRASASPSITGNTFSWNGGTGLYFNAVTSAGVTSNAFLQNSDGLYMISSDATVRDNDFKNTTLNNVGLHQANSNIALYNGNFLDNSEYGLYGDAASETNWTIASAVTCRNSLVNISDGWVKLAGGSLTQDNCTVSIGGNPITFAANQESVTVDAVNVAPGGSQVVGDAGVGATVNISSAAGYADTVTITSFSDVPAGASGFTLAKLGNWVEFNATDTANMDWAIIKLYYTDAEVTAAGLDEGSLVIEYYNATSAAWETFSAPRGGVDTVNNYVWANTTHFSGFGVFGSAPAAATPAPASSSSSHSGSSDDGAGGITAGQGFTLSAGEETTVTALLNSPSSFSISSASHSLTVTKINFNARTCTIVLSSNPVTLDLKEGESKEVYLDADSYPDLKVTLKSVLSASSVYLGMEVLANPSEEPVGLPTVTSPSPVPPTPPSPTLTWALQPESAAIVPSGPAPMWLYAVASVLAVVALAAFAVIGFARSKPPVMRPGHHKKYTKKIRL
jgi:parallel beta-helix repeat protein